MIQMLRKEAVSGSIDDLAHIDTAHMLADCLTKISVKPDLLIKTVESGVIHNIDSNPEFRTLLQHKAYLVGWVAHTLRDAPDVTTVLNDDVSSLVSCYYCQPDIFTSFLAIPSEFTRIVEHTTTSQAPLDTHTHQHSCAWCSKLYRHTHGGPHRHSHDGDSFLCCYSTCEDYYGLSTAHTHNEYSCHLVQNQSRV